MRRTLLSVHFIAPLPSAEGSLGLIFDPVDGGDIFISIVALPPLYSVTTQEMLHVGNYVYKCEILFLYITK
jgi:hypothetical protein